MSLEKSFRHVLVKINVLTFSDTYAFDVIWTRSLCLIMLYLCLYFERHAFNDSEVLEQ